MGYTPHLLISNSSDAILAANEDVVKGQDSIKGRSIIFPQGQLMLKSKEGLPIASLSTNRVEWNGDMVTLQSWDDYAGDPTTFEKKNIKKTSNMFNITSLIFF